MNNISITPYVFMHALQIQNVKRNTVQKVDITELNKESEVYIEQKTENITIEENKEHEN